MIMKKRKIKYIDVKNIFHNLKNNIIKKQDIFFNFLFLKSIENVKLFFTENELFQKIKNFFHIKKIYFF